MKKFLAMMLTLALVVCMMPAATMTAWADGKTSLTTDIVSIDTTSYVYDGCAKTPAVKVNNVAVTVGDDYEITYASNTAVGTGTVTVKATAANTLYTGQVEKQFTIGKLDLTDSKVTIKETTTPITSAIVTSDMVQVLYDGKAISPDCYDVVGAAYSTADRVVVTVTAKGDNLVPEKKRSAIFYLKTVFDETYTVSAAEQTYTGEALTPAVIIKKGATALSLKKGVDYTVAYSTNVNVADIPQIEVTGIGKYAGTISGTFAIKARSITASGITATATAVTVGKQPTVIVTDGDKTLQEGTDFCISSSVDTSTVGTKNIEITGINNYVGSKTLSFKVVEAGHEITSASLTGTTSVWYCGSTQKASVNVKVEDTTLKEGTDYTVKYRYTYTDSKDVVKTATTTSPVDARTYEVLVTGIGNYAGTDIDAGDFTITPLDTKYVEITGISASYSYSGTAVTPVPTVKSILSGGPTFVKDKDYTVSYYNNDKVYSTSSKVKARVTITPKAGGNLTGSSIYEEFSLTGKSISGCSAVFTNGRSAVAYNGTIMNPELTVRDGYTTLSKGIDYSVSYKDADGKTVTSMRDAGKYTVVITGITYSGTKELSFEITGTSIANYVVTLDKTSAEATGSAIPLPKVTSVASGTSSKLYATDYAVTYQNEAGPAVTTITAPGTYKVVVTGKNGYYGKVYATFKVIGLSQTITGLDSTYKVYTTSEAFKLAPKAKEGSFTFTSSDPTVATVTATGVITPLKAGRTKITVSVTGTKKYDAVSKTVIIKVYPKKAVLSQKPWTDGKKAQLKARWNKEEGVTKYQIRYSRAKSFAEGTYLTKTVSAADNSYTTQSTTIKGLKSGYTYYVKVRAVKEVYNDYGEKQTYYGAWSGWKSVKVK